MSEFRITRRADALIPDTSHLEAVNAELSAQMALLRADAVRADQRIEGLEATVEHWRKQLEAAELLIYAIRKTVERYQSRRIRVDGSLLLSMIEYGHEKRDGD